MSTHRDQPREKAAHRRSEDSLRKQHGYLRLLQQVTVAANESDALDEALRFAIHRICAFMKWPIGHVWYPAEDASGLVSARMWSIAASPEHAAFREVSEAMTFAPGVGLPGRVLETGRPAWIRDVQTDGNFPRAEIIRDSHLTAAFAFPVLAGKEVVAVLEFFSERASEPDELLLEIMAQVGVQLGRVAERQRAREALHASAERLRSLMESAVDAIVTSDSAGIIRDWSRGGTTIFGYSREEALGRSVDILMPERYVEAHRRGMERLERSGEAHVLGRTVELHGLRRNGEEFPLELSLSRWTGHGKSYYTAIIRDITVRRQDEERILRLNEELEQRNKELQEFAYVASHDLQEPLRKIGSFADLLVTDYGEEMDDIARDYVNRMQAAALRMSTLLRDLLSFSRVATQGQALTPVALNAVVADVLSDLELQVKEAGGTVDVDDLPVIRADETQMRQLFQNLISNALKFHAPGEAPSVRIRANVEQNGGPAMHRIDVTDAGIGFDEKYLDRIFMPFQRLHGRHAIPGTGMGLAICRRIVERHGGRITARSKPGEGSTFSVLLPAERPADAAA